MELSEVQEIARPIVGRRGRRLSPEDRDDLLQDVLVKYADAWPAGSPDNVAAWLETVVARRLIDFYRMADRRREDVDEEPPEIDFDLFVHLQRPASLQGMQGLLIDQIINLVPDGELLEWRYVDGCSSADLARRLGIAVSAADQRVSRAKKRLRAALASRPDLVAELARSHPRAY